MSLVFMKEALELAFYLEYCLTIASGS